VILVDEVDDWFMTWFARTRSRLGWWLRPSINALAERLGVSQSRISRIERGELDRAEIATVRGYVEALGGEVEIVAKFGDERITVG
jgi:transcriptional regulator with XRE-family HTH domain